MKFFMSNEIGHGCGNNIQSGFLSNFVCVRGIRTGVSISKEFLYSYSLLVY